MKRTLITMLLAGLMFATASGAALANPVSANSYVPADQAASVQYVISISAAGGALAISAAPQNTPDTATAIPAATLSHMRESKSGAAAAALAATLAPRSASPAAKAHARAAGKKSARTRASRSRAAKTDSSAVGIPAAQIVRGSGGSIPAGLVIALAAILLLASGAGILGMRRQR